MNNKGERKYFATFLDINPLGDPTSAVTDSTEYKRIGKDLSEYTEALNPEVSTEQNILGENVVTHSGFKPSSEVTPYYVRFDENDPDSLAVKLMDIANNRRTGKGTVTTKVDLLLDPSGKVLWAYREDVQVVPTSVGGDTSGVQIPFSVYNCGNRVKGTFDLKTKTFTASAEAVQASASPAKASTVLSKT